jgi:hypothetical protein
MMMSTTWKTWLDVWLLVMFGAAGLFALAAFPPLDAAVRLFYDVIYWPLDGNSAWGEDLRPSVGILGAVFMGMTLFMKIAIDAAQMHSDQALWRKIFAALLAWYVVDSIISVVTGVPVNALSNTLIFASGAVPFIASGVLNSAKRHHPA